MTRFRKRGYSGYRRRARHHSTSKAAATKTVRASRERILSQIAAGHMSLDQAATLLANLEPLANLDKSPARTPTVDIRDPHRTIAEYIRRAFPGIEKKNCKSVTIYISKLDSLLARVREAVRTVGIDDEARAEALRAFQGIFGSRLPRRIEPDREADSTFDIRARNDGNSSRSSALCRPAKSFKSNSKNRKAQTAATPLNNTSPARTKVPPHSAAPAKTPPGTSSPSKPLKSEITSTGSGSRPADMSRTAHNPMTDGERRAVLAALDEAGESLGTTLLSVKSKIGQRRLEDILPVLLNEGALKQVEKGTTARYTRP